MATLKHMQETNHQQNRSWRFLLFYSVLEGTQTDEKKFLQKCENWMKFLEKMKEALKTNVPGQFEELQEQQRIYEVKLTLKIEIPWMMKVIRKSLENTVPFKIRSV